MRPRRTVEDRHHVSKSSADKSERPQRRSHSANKTDVRDSDDMSKNICQLMSTLQPLDGRRYSSTQFQLRPSQRSLFTVLATCMHEFDQAFQYEDIDNEFIPEMFKMMGHFGTINKNIFMPVGAPHTWTTCISLMHWLTQLTRYHMSEAEAGDNNKPFYEEDPLVQQLIVEGFNEDPEADTTDVKGFDDLLNEAIRKEEAEVEVRAKEKEGIQRQIADLKANYPDINQLRQSAESTERQLAQEKLELRNSEIENERLEEQIKRMLQQELQMDNQTKRLDDEVEEVAQKIKSTGTSSQRVDAIQTQIQRIQANMKKKKQEFAEFNRGFEHKVEEVLAQAQFLQDDINTLKAKQAADAQHLKQRRLIFEFKDLKVNELADIMRSPNIMSEENIYHFYEEELEQMDAYFQKKNDMHKAQRLQIEKQVEKVQAEARQIDRRVETENHTQTSLTEQEAQHQKYYEANQEKLARAKQQLRKAVKTREDIEDKLLRIQRQYKAEQEEIEKKSMELETCANWIDLYSKKCDSAIQQMILQAQKYDEEFKNVMRGQAQSFSSLNKHMQQIYGSDLTKKV